MRLFPKAIIFAVLALTVACHPSRAADEPLAYVPPSAGVFAHVRFGDVWNSPVGQEIRKAAGKDLDKAIGKFQEEVGFPLETLDTATFCYPDFPAGPGDERTFVVIGTTTKPYDRDALLKKVREKGAKPKDGLVELEAKFKLQFVSDTMFLVMHDSQVAKFAAKGPLRDAQPGVMTEAIKIAAKRHFVMSLDFSKLPNEFFTNAPPQLQPFLPLLKSKASQLCADLKERQLTVGLNFLNADATAAEEAERSFKLLMKLATDGLADVLKDEKSQKDIQPFLPLLKELDRGLNNIKVVRTDARLETSMALKVDQELGAVVAEYVRTYRDETSRAEASNNLRQIGVAMHSYQTNYQGFPAAAICDKKGKPLLSWRVALLPYIEEGKLYEEFKLDEPWDSDHNKKLIDKMPKVFALPGAKPDGKTHFRVFHGNGAAFELIEQTTIASITDGTSNTLMVVETADASTWTKPDDIEFDEKLPVEKLLRFVNDKTSVLFCDGSVRFLKKGLGDETWRLLIQKNDGQTLPPFDK